MLMFQLSNWGGAMQSWDTFCAADPRTLMTAPPAGGLDVVDVFDRLCSINFTQLVTELNAYQGLDRLNALVSLYSLWLLHGKLECEKLMCEWRSFWKFDDERLF